MSALTWSQLRPWAGSHYAAFEELCCQLAAHEPAPLGAEYRRVGAPDAGVECIWRDPDESVRAWQAKFFLRPPSAAEWRQLDESVHQAVDHYPDLVRYTVCLPLDRPDARLPGRKSMMAKWDERVARWKKYARERGRRVAFDYWGEHEIADRLGRKEHAGRLYFWFNTNALSPEWFRDRFAIARANAGERYSPELHVDVEISTTFDALSRHPRFLKRLQRQWGIVKRELQRGIPSLDAEPRVPDESSSRSALNGHAHAAARSVITGEVEAARIAATHARTVVAELDVPASRAMPFGDVCAALAALRDAIHRLDAAMDKGDAAASAVRSSAAPPAVGTAESAATDGANKPSRSHSGDERRHTFENQKSHLWKARRAVDVLHGMCIDESATVANSAALLVTGEAGTGKTHLLCDVTERAVTGGEPCVLLLGEQIVRGDPWPQLMQQLQLDCRTPDEFLGALSAAAEAAGRRAVVLIDALNEGEGRQVWRPHLAGLLATAGRYPWVAVALSVRSSYVDVVVTDAASKMLTTVEHVGFAEHEGDATRRFFDAYGLERPSVPLLAPEFANPLFLKLFCQGLKNRGLSRVPLGLQGISAVFDFFLSSVQQRLAIHLDYDVVNPVVERAVSVLAAEMRALSDQWVPRERAMEITEAVLPSRGWEHSLMRQLISEGVLSEEMVWVNAQQRSVHAVRFTYERLGDHRVAALLLDEHLGDAAVGSAHLVTSAPAMRRRTSAKNAERLSARRTASNAPSLSLSGLLSEEKSAWYYQGILNALAIQVPERTGRELWELGQSAPLPSKIDKADEPANADALVVFPSRPILEAFLESLEWRRPDAIGHTALGIVNRNVRVDTPIGARIRDVVMSAAARPGHPLNADYLDAMLAPETMPERDVWWSTHLANQEDVSTPIGRLIDWAWRVGREAQHADDAVMLAAVALAWTLTTSHREVRDHATKGLVSLLHRRPHLLRRLLERFRAVNDLYVAERLYAVAYGCALLGLERSDLKSLARDVYETVFADGAPPPHLLLRDYARGIVELAGAEGLLSDDQLTRARPPYRSDPPGPAPSEKQLKARYYVPFKLGKGEDYSSLWFSLGAHGDFARYIVGTNSQSFEWSARPLYGPHPATKRERYDAFVDALPSALVARWRDLQERSFRLKLPMLREILKEMGKEQMAESLEQRDLDALLNEERRAFRRSLPLSMRPEFDRVRKWGNERSEPEPFDLEDALRWLFQRVVDLGWTPQRFYEFDRHRAGYEGRMSHRVERIGKKYQWIAWEEFTARVADNFAFRDDRWSDDAGGYHGPWQLNGRDIDPSYLGRGGHGFSSAAQPAWWQSVAYRDADWRRIVDDVQWMATTKDLPRLEGIIQATRQSDETRWWWLRGDVEWREPEPPDEEPYERSRRSIRYWINAVLVHADQRDRLLRWARGRDLWQADLYDKASVTQVFLGEYPFAAAFRAEHASALAKPWTRLDGRLPVPILRPALTFHWGASGYDRSIEEALNLSVPAPALLARPRRGAPRCWPQPLKSGLYYNPSLASSGPDALLARAKAFRKRLDRRGWEVIWLMTGEKLIIGDTFKNGREEWGGRLELSAVGCFAEGEWREWHVGYLNRGKSSRERLTW